MNRRLIGAVGGIAVALAIVGLPIVGNLEPSSRPILAIIVMAVIFWATDVLNAGMTAVLTLSLLLAKGVAPSVALSGFASSAFWIVVSVLFFGYAMDKTGLARRIAYHILKIFKPTYTGILFAFFAIGLVLAFGIPSMTVRTSIMIPIAWALVQALGIPLPSKGSALIILTTFEMAVLPGCAILTGALWGPFLSGLFASQKIPLSWNTYAVIMTIPTLIWCLLILLANRWALRPEKELSVGRDFVLGEIKKLGPMGRSEIITAIIVVISLIAWSTQKWHKIPSEAIGMLALTAIFATSVLKTPEISTGIPWHLAMFIGGSISLASVMTTYKLNAWIGGFIVSAMQPAAGNPIAVIMLIGIGVTLIRFIEPTAFITIAAFFLALVGIAAKWGVQPLVLAGAIIFPVHVFWFNYQNIWITMTEGITKHVPYTDGNRLHLATVYAIVTLISLGIAACYWKLIGAI